MNQHLYFILIYKLTGTPLFGFGIQIGKLADHSIQAIRGSNMASILASNRANILLTKSQCIVKTAVQTFIILGLVQQSRWLFCT